MVNYTLGEGFKKLTEFEVKSATGDICISADIDFETRSSFEFPVIATDRGKFQQKYISLFSLISVVSDYASYIDFNTFCLIMA